MKKKKLDEIDEFDIEVPEQLFCKTKIKECYYLRGQRIKIPYGICLGKDPLAVFNYFLKIVGLISEEYSANAAIGYKLLPFGMLFGKDFDEYCKIFNKSFSKYALNRSYDQRSYSKIVSKWHHHYLSSLEINVEEFDDILKSEYVKNEIALGKEIILLKIELTFDRLEIEEKNKFELRERENPIAVDFRRGNHILLSHLFRYDFKYGKGRMIEMIFDDILEIASLYFEHRVTSRQEYFDLLTQIASLANERIKIKGYQISNGYKKSLRDFSTRFQEEMKEKRKKKEPIYEPLKDFCCQFFRDLIKDLIRNRMAKRCLRCKRVIRYSKKQKRCTLLKEGIACGKKAADKRRYNRRNKEKEDVSSIEIPLQKEAKKKRRKQEKKDKNK